MHLKCSLGIVLAAVLAPLSGWPLNISARMASGLRAQSRIRRAQSFPAPRCNPPMERVQPPMGGGGIYSHVLRSGLLRFGLRLTVSIQETCLFRQERDRSRMPTCSLAILTVTTNVEVRDDASGMDSDNGTGATVLDRKEVQMLADDPDDFLRQLQVLASEAGGDPTSAIITVNGFQNASALPPKSAIASIRVNPDLFSSEYQWAPFGGGLIEIFTKPGADSFHGALFLTDSDGVFNATDPFSVTATPASKQRCGFELSGPIISRNSGFALALEKRDIDEFNVVDAVTLDANGNQTGSQQTIAAPQRLWIASGARRLAGNGERRRNPFLVLQRQQSRQSGDWRFDTR